MSKKINALEYIRGISMLGVIGIHTGAYSLTNPFVNIHLFALFEIFTRFSVPIFFFVSSFGLFKNQNLNASLDFGNFMIRRLRTVLIPYVVWSLLYMLHYSWVSGDLNIWKPNLFIKFLLFGLASYQLYFLVILLWFYSLMPLWRLVVKYICTRPLTYLSILFILQIAFNYYSSYLLSPNFPNHYINLLVQHRLSYWVIHYVFIFLFGAVCAIHYQAFLNYLDKYKKTVTWAFALSLTGILAFYYYLLFIKGYTPEQAVNTAHQLSPIGVVYTLTATLYFFAIFSFNKISKTWSSLLSHLGHNSYAVYLVHPIVMYYLISYITGAGKIMTAPITMAFFIITVAISITLAILIKKISQFIPILSLLLTGTSTSRKSTQPS
ncbi:acyltransferase [Dendrosporobacter sp. 1207_IL3150]|uniref:acyltransferase n=1 Tax=Dendrosporobacter sp. 1207_IL3150 TaxID=3084054 RepID=UPI002FDA5FF8